MMSVYEHVCTNIFYETLHISNIILLFALNYEILSILEKFGCTFFSPRVLPYPPKYACRAFGAQNGQVKT